MVRFNSEDQFNFLISCIRWSNNGRVDFTEVARECGICTKGAAAKRYERMMKAHSIGPEPPYPSREQSESAESTPTKKESKIAKKETNIPKKEPIVSKGRKRKIISDDDEEDDEDAELSMPAFRSKRIKKEPVKKEVVKQEQTSPKYAKTPVKEEPTLPTFQYGAFDGPSDYALTLQRWGLNPALAQSNRMSQELEHVEPQMDSFPDFPDSLKLDQDYEEALPYGGDGAYGLPPGLWDQPLESQYAEEHLGHPYPALVEGGGDLN